MAIDPLLNTVNEICKKSPLQKKLLLKLYDQCEESYLVYANLSWGRYIDFLQTEGISMDRIVNAYLSMVKGMVVEQVNFKRFGAYRHSTQKEVSHAVYSNDELMLDYMIGLLFSQFIWPNHRQMFLFFKERIKNLSGDKYLEIGPGHGLFFTEALYSGNFKKHIALDISRSSLEMTRSFIEYVPNLSLESIEFKQLDFCAYDENETFDFITIGEVLEHVEQPLLLLQKTHELLKPGGRTYISTCANCPALDHIYLYSDLLEIKEHIQSAGLKITEEIYFSVDAIPEKQWIKEKANVTYACLAEKK